MRGSLLLLISFGALLGAPHLGLSPILCVQLLSIALFALAYNILLGYGGMLSFGHAMFFALSGYLTGYAMIAWTSSALLAVLVGVTSAGILGGVVGRLTIRRHGIYFAMATLALGQLVFFVLYHSSFTGGENGLQGVRRGTLFGLFSLSSDLGIYYLCLGLFLAGVFTLWRIIHSPFGHVLAATRENENRALSLGFDVHRVKLTAFVLSAVLSGLAGSIKVLAMGFETLSDANWHFSGQVILMCLLGGMSTFWGPAAGAVLIVGTEIWLAGAYGEWATVFMGVLFVLCVLFFRDGIVGRISYYRFKDGVQK